MSGLKEEKPKWYLTNSSTRGYSPSKDRYIEFPTEDEYYEYIREDTNE